jgi:predicted GNAT family acetyltransferase
MADQVQPRVTDHPPRRRYDLRLEDTIVGAIDYRREADAMVLVHVVVDRAFRGRGFGSRLVAEALDDIRARGLSVVPECPFVAWYLERHPEHQDLVALPSSRRVDPPPTRHP